jgi:selenocysteine-specific elongation factor
VAAELRVVATAGHVDHGKSALIERLTGSDPDRLAEEQRRGLTIDLGYAWCHLPGQREIGFVDVPGHERFVRNMLAGVGPVRLVLFVVAADEGWKPQSEEHLQILDVLGMAGGVIALTKRDLVDDETLAIAEEEVRERVAGTVLDGAPLVPVSAHRGDGIEALRIALAEMMASAPQPEAGRTRLFVDRVFTIRGAGTVATGTLTGDRLTVGDEVEIVPRGRRARIRSLQTHRRDEERADPVSRVAANLVGIERDDLRRGDVLAVPGAWPTTSLVEARLRPVRGLGHAITSRGAFTVHAGAAEAGAQLRILGGSSVEPGGQAIVRLKLDRPLALEPFDRFVLREEGRSETVGGGEVLDVDPPARAGKDPGARLAARAEATRDELPALLVAERGAVTAHDAVRVTGSHAAGGIQVGAWLLAPAVHDAVETHVTDDLHAYHASHPLNEGAPLDDVRRMVGEVLAGHGAPAHPDLTEAVLVDLAARGRIARTATAVRLASHRVALDDHTGDVERLLEAITGDHEAKPPGVDELVAAGFGRDVIDAAARAGMVVRLTPAIVVAPSFVDRAAELVHAHATTGITVSALRQALGTSRKYAVPLAEHLDRTGVTRREGDLRYPR